MCQKGSCAEGRVAVPTARLCKARFGTKYLPVLGPSGQGRVPRGPESPTAGPPSVPPGRPHPRERRQARGGRPATAGPTGATPSRRDSDGGVFYEAGLYIAHMAETTYAAETAKAIAGTVPTREEHARSQPRAHFAKSNHANQAQPVTRSDPPLNGSDAIGTDLHATTAATSAAIGPLAKSNADTYAQL